MLILAKYNRIGMASGGVTYDAEIKIPFNEWEDIIGINLPQTVLNGRDIIQGVALRLQQEGLAAIAKDHAKYKDVGYFTVNQSSQADID